MNEKYDFCISIAGHIIGIHTMYTEVYSLCEKYISEITPEFHVYIDKNDIMAERIEAEKKSISRNDAYLETLAVYRKISEKMLLFDIFLMHGAVVAVDNNAYMFIANSGTGKTTHIKKWVENIGGAIVVNGDKPLIKITDNQVFACGTPWCGKEHWSTNCIMPLKAIILMERADNNTITEISYGQAFISLLEQIYRPNDAEKMRKTLALLSRTKNKVRFYKFYFNNYKDDAFDVAYKSLISGSEET